MIHTNITSAYTEIYVDNENYITESYPTYFHTFVRRKILGADDSVDNYKEVNEEKKNNRR